MDKEIKKVRRITPLGDLIAGIPSEYRTPDVIKRLEKQYQFEINQITYYESQAENTESVLCPFKKGGSQHIAEFWVNDLGKPVGNAYNFHGQNTSRWLYAGCILFDEKDGCLSGHH